jgi:hypothetical protein
LEGGKRFILLLFVCLMAFSINNAYAASPTLNPPELNPPELNPPELHPPKQDIHQKKLKAPPKGVDGAAPTFADRKVPEKKKKQAQSLNEVDVTHEQLMELADLSYEKDGKLTNEQLQELMGKEWSIAGRDYNPETGFAALAFKNHKTGEIVVAYRGSDESVDFTKTNSKIFLQLPATQLKDARNFANQIKKVYGSSNSIVFTGHSLGGFLAQKMAAENNMQAVTYNAPGMKPKPLRNAPSAKVFYDFLRSASNPNMNGLDDLKNITGQYDDDIVNYVDKDDIVGTYGVHYGRVIMTDEGEKPKEVTDYSLFRQFEDHVPFKAFRQSDQLLPGNGGWGNFRDHDMKVFKEHFKDGYIHAE